MLPSPCQLAAFRAASPPSPPIGWLILCLERDGNPQVSAAARAQPRDGVFGGCRAEAGGYPAADGDFLEVPRDTRHFLPCWGASFPAALPGRSPRSERPLSTKTSASASGDGGSDTHSVSTICGREKARLPAGASGAWVENSERLRAGGAMGQCRELPGALCVPTRLGPHRWWLQASLFGQGDAWLSGPSCPALTSPWSPLAQ